MAGKCLIKNIAPELKDLTVCPNCGTRQKKNKNWGLEIECDDEHCGGYVYLYHARDGDILIWGNENWD